ncbi:MAG TPA: hypothetical protein VLT61_10005 [Anaeromyxobacteraceae bacterium]|nr:hypothetical protein [Anaeromyxobacteraceae bacterium]
MNVARSARLAGHGVRPRRAAGLAAAASLSLSLSLSLAACTPEPAVGRPVPFSLGGAGTYAGLSHQIFVPRCASGSCHGGSPPPFFPQLDAEAGWAALVNVPSLQAVMDLVEPGVPDQSWLMVRLRGEEGLQTMPPNDPLSAAELAAVEGWIANGAPND